MKIIHTIIFFALLCISTLCLAANPRIEFEELKDSAEKKILFKDIPTNTAFNLAKKRFAQKNPDKFEVLATLICNKDNQVQFYANQVNADFTNHSIGYLPGELVTFACEIKNKKICEASYIPVPVIINRKDGTKFMEAFMVNLEPTTYLLALYADSEEEYVYRSTSDGQVAEKLYKGPGKIIYIPGTKNKKGGEGQLQFTFKNGESHSIRLPYGAELIPYNQGKKKFIL